MQQELTCVKESIGKLFSLSQGALDNLEVCRVRKEVADRLVWRSLVQGLIGRGGVAVDCSSIAAHDDGFSVVGPLEVFVTLQLGYIRLGREPAFISSFVLIFGKKCESPRWRFDAADG